MNDQNNPIIQENLSLLNNCDFQALTKRNRMRGSLTQNCVIYQIRAWTDPKSGKIHQLSTVVSDPEDTTVRTVFLELLLSFDQFKIQSIEFIAADGLEPEAESVLKQSLALYN